MYRWRSTGSSISRVPLARRTQNATGRDHQYPAGLAVHPGAVLDLPTVGVTDRPLLARGDLPPDVAWATAPLWLDGELVEAWLRTRPGARPVAVHAAWRTDVERAIAVVRVAWPLRLGWKKC